MLDKSVLTIATGKPFYVNLAVNLARSFKLWHKESPIEFYLATDRKELVPNDLCDIKIVEIKKDQYGTGFSPKLFLDKISKTNKTLFIDADCLCFSRLDEVFARFSGKSVSVVGDLISEGNFSGDVSKIVRRFNIEAIPRFVGGIYYFEKGEVCNKVFTTAREMEEQYDEIGLVRLRGVPNEEPLLAISMALHGQKPVEDDGRIKADAMFFPSLKKADVIRGKTLMHSSKESIKLMPHWNNLIEVSPKIIHFNSNFAEIPPYTREIWRLKKIIKLRYPLWIIDILAFIIFDAPYSITTKFKNTFRPLYRSLFGTRPIKQSKRL